MWQEKRQTRRLSLSLPINYEVLDTEEKEASNTISKNISEGGLKVVFKKFYPPKTKFLLRINLEGINKVIETIAETAWSFNMHFSNTYYSGLRFIYLDPKKQQMIKEYITIKGITNPTTNN